LGKLDDFLAKFDPKAEKPDDGDDEEKQSRAAKMSAIRMKQLARKTSTV
jgi:hypothetical protein